ncbi:hypothetical protein Fmac_007234 [Flemingia macrophylla]|uniref:Berberine/berberine-like domain-containing protein n=1 Tax=Flemingia macrophylla TaxID=520843 RepID=A0ABD1NCW5_9FABA
MGGYSTGVKINNLGFLGAINQYRDANKFLKVKEEYDPQGIFSHYYKIHLLNRFRKIFKIDSRNRFQRRRFKKTKLSKLVGEPFSKLILLKPVIITGFKSFICFLFVLFGVGLTQASFLGHAGCPLSSIPHEGGGFSDHHRMQGVCPASSSSVWCGALGGGGCPASVFGRGGGGGFPVSSARCERGLCVLRGRGRRRPTPRGVVDAPKSSLGVGGATRLRSRLGGGAAASSRGEGGEAPAPWHGGGDKRRR